MQKWKKNQVEERREWERDVINLHFLHNLIFSISTFNFSPSHSKSHSRAMPQQQKKVFQIQDDRQSPFFSRFSDLISTIFSIFFPIKIVPKWLWKWVLIFSLLLSTFYTIPFTVLCCHSQYFRLTLVSREKNVVIGKKSP